MGARLGRLRRTLVPEHAPLGSHERATVDSSARGRPGLHRRHRLRLRRCRSGRHRRGRGQQVGLLIGGGRGGRRVGRRTSSSRPAGEKTEALEIADPLRVVRPLPQDSSGGAVVRDDVGHECVEPRGRHPLGVPLRPDAVTGALEDGDTAYRVAVAVDLDPRASRSVRSAPVDREALQSPAVDAAVRLGARQRCEAVALDRGEGRGAALLDERGARTGTSQDHARVDLQRPGDREDPAWNRTTPPPAFFAASIAA